MPRTKKADDAAVEGKAAEGMDVLAAEEAEAPVAEYTVDDARMKIAEVIIRKGEDILARPDRVNDPIFMNSMANLFNAIR